jgi:transmembrane sensor
MSTKHTLDEQAIRWYVKLQSPDCSAQQEAEFYQWLEASSAHQAAFIRTEQAWVAGKAAQALLTPPKSVPQSYFGYWVGAAAAMLMAVAIYLIQPSPEVPQTSHYATNASEHNQVTLSDGTLLHLHINTDISVVYKSTRREITLRKGRLFLNVAKNPDQPLYVSTANGHVKVLGTQFAVEQLQNDLRVTVLEGRVGLLSSVDQNHPIVELSGNEQIRFNEALSGGKAIFLDAHQETAWISGHLTFNGKPLAEVIQTLNQHLTSPIEVLDQALKQKNIVGRISIKDSKSAAENLAIITGAIATQDSTNSKFILSPKTELENK